MLPSSMDAPSLKGITVVLVEDDDDSRELVTELLQLVGAVVHAAPDTSQAMEALHAFKPDVLVSDIGLPGEDGHSFIRRCRALEEVRIRDIPAVALTAFTRSADREKALNAGFNEYLKKPVDLHELIATIGRLSLAPA